MTNAFRSGQDEPVPGRKQLGQDRQTSRPGTGGNGTGDESDHSVSALRQLGLYPDNLDPRELDVDYGGGRVDPDGWQLPLHSDVEQRLEESRTVKLLIKRPAPLSERNWRTYAAANYDNAQCIGDEEFEQDLKRLKYIKKAMTRYKTTGELCERLVLNHLIVLCNVFGPTVLCRLVVLKMADQLEYVKPFLVMLQIFPAVVYGVAGRDWYTDEIGMNEEIVSILRRI